MDRKLEDFIYNIENGKISLVDERTIPFDYLLIEYKDGKTVLDIALENNIYVHTSYQKRLGAYPKAVMSYLKNDKYISSLDVTEDTLFTQIDGVNVLEHIKEFDQIYSIDLSVVVNHTEIIDFLIEKNLIYHIGKLNPLLVDKLFELDNEGNFLIEKYVTNKDAFSKLIGVTSNPLIIGICKKHNVSDLLKYVNVDLLLSVDGNGKTYLETFINDGIKLDSVDNIPRNQEFVSKLFELEQYEALSKAGYEGIMLYKVNEEETLLEYLIKNNKIDKLHFNIGDKKTLEIISKYDVFDIIDGVNKSLIELPTCEVLDNFPQETKPFYQFLVLDKKVRNPFPSFGDRTIEQVKFLCTVKRFDLLKDGIYDLLLEPVEEDKLLIDFLMENKVEIDVKYQRLDPLVLSRILEKNNYEYLNKFSTDMLLNVDKGGVTYFEHLLGAVKRGEFKFNIHEEVDYEFDISKKAKLFTLVAKHDLLNYLSRIEKDDLLKEEDGKTFLEHLLDVDPSLTVEKIIPEELISDMQVVFILQKRGIDTTSYDTPLIEEKGYNLDYLNAEESSLGMGPLLLEGDTLLNKLYDLFSNDGKSDKDLITALVAGYKEALIVNYDITVSELRNLVKVKEDNLDKFFYVVSETGAFFSKIDLSVHCESKVISTIMHETGHALHYFLSDFKVPDDYSEILQHARDNVVNIEEVEAFADKYHEVRTSIRDEVNAKYQTYFEEYYNEDKRVEIEKFLNESKETKREEYKKFGVSDNVIDIIISKAFTVDEYIEHQKRVFIEEYTDAILRTEHNIMMVIGDILDAIYGGELHSRELRNANGDKIKGTCGHGIAYYGSYAHGFDEMIANFGTLLKSRSAVEDLKALKELVGEEVFTMISDFYYTNISKSEPLDISEGITL